MSTYLIFFGKSQDFNFYAFDSKGYIHDFSSVIKDFDKLESNYFTVDAIDNQDILAKYVFQSNSGAGFSLLKLYSFAQAINGHRIVGSTVGVAFLSSYDLALSEFNVSLLRKAKDNLSKLSLNGLKFNKSNFLEDAIEIWKAFTNSGEGNLFDKIEKISTSVTVPQKELPTVYFVPSVFKDLSWITPELSKSQKIYLSSDKAHILRAKNKLGDFLSIFKREGTTIVPFIENHRVNEEKNNNRESVDDNKANNDQDKRKNTDTTSLEIQLSDSQYEKSRLIADLKVEREKTRKKNALIKIFLYPLD